MSKTKKETAGIPYAFWVSGLNKKYPICDKIINAPNADVKYSEHYMIEHNEE